MKKIIAYSFLLVSMVLTACGGATSEPVQTTDPQEIENRVNATLTAMAPTAAPPATETPPPTEVPTVPPPPSPSPTPTSTPTQEPIEGDPAKLLGDPDGLDTFDTKSNWTLFDTDCFKSEIKDGMYVMTAKGEQGMMCWEISWPEMEDYYVDTMVFMPDSCSSGDRFGLLFRAPDNFRGYQFGLTCDGKYSLTLWDGESTKTLIEPTENSAINIGLDAVNRLGVAAHGSTFDFYANGFFLEELVDNTFTDTGKIGYFVRAATTDGFVVEYDNLTIWLLDDRFIPPSATQPPITGVLPTPDTGVPSVTSTTYANIRSGPGTIYPVLFVVSPDSTTEALGYSSDRAWYAVQVPTSYIQSGTGWVSADFVTASNTGSLSVIAAPPPPTEVEPSPPGQGDPSVTTVDAVNIRSGPSNQCTSYGVPPIGTTALAIGISADAGWYAIRIPTEYSSDGIGWVNANYVTAKNTGSLQEMESALCP